MPSYVTPKKNTAFKCYVGLIDQTNTKLLKANPTIASGDFKVSTDGGAFANLATLPSANPASGRAIMIDLSAGEMNGDNIVVQCVDAAGAEWCDLFLNIQTTARQIDDLAFPATSGRSMATDASGNTAADAKLWNGLTTVALPLVPTVAGRTADIDASGGVEVGSFQTGALTNAAFAAGAIDAAAIAANAIGASELASDAAAEIADAVLDRDMSTGADSGSSTVRTMRQALRFLRNKWTLVGTTLTVYKEDDSTSSWTGTVTTDAAATPITANDPAGP